MQLYNMYQSRYVIEIMSLTLMSCVNQMIPLIYLHEEWVLITEATMFFQQSKLSFNDNRPLVQDSYATSPLGGAKAFIVTFGVCTFVVN